MSKISIHQAFEPDEVDLWADDGGGLYKTKPLTRSVIRQLAEFEDKAAEVGEDADADEGVAVLARMFDALLASANGSKVKPSTLVLKKWKADQVSKDELEDLIVALTGANRPT